jgi:CheY-like chemotaxis protein
MMNALNKSARTVLMADDDADDCLLTRDAFRRGQVREELRCVGDGEALIKDLRSRGDKPTLILLDLNMPRMNGIEALKEIKADPDLREIPVVVLTTSSAEDDIAKSYQLGANSFITKPHGLESYQEMVKSLSRYWFDTVTLPHERA